MKRCFSWSLLGMLLIVLLAMPAAAGSPTRSYLILGKGGKLSQNSLQQAQALGGTVVSVMPEIGVAVVTSANPHFALDAAAVAGLEDVAPNISMQWLKPTADLQSQAAGNPPNSLEDDFFFNLQWNLDAINAPEAWALGARGQGVRVAVLDSGFELFHPDLFANVDLTTSRSFVPGEGLQFVPNAADRYGHGTHVAGIIAAADNGLGIIGVAPEAQLILVKVLRDDGQGDFAWLIQGIVHAANVGADVINMSLGDVLPRKGLCDESGCLLSAKDVQTLVKALNRATRYAAKRGATLVAAAGNSYPAINFDQAKDLIFLPADAQEVLTISATGPLGWGIDPTTSLDEIAFYTNYGRSYVDFAAPGGNYDVNILLNPGLVDPRLLAPCTVGGVPLPFCGFADWVFSTVGPPSYFFYEAGTSMAAAHVSGVAALIIGQNGGDMKPSKVEAKLRRSADDLGDRGRDPFYGFGRVNALRAVE